MPLNVCLPRSMLRVMICLLLLALLLVCNGSDAPTFADELNGWRLSWSDEFNGSKIDARNWSFDLGGKGWGNHELETYTDRDANAYVKDGTLVIRALKETYTGADQITRHYTSARLLSKNKFSESYGRFEARIQLPLGRGIWPAFWMLGADVEKVGWPKCGEIDIMENVGSEPGTVLGTLHGPGYSGSHGITTSYRLPGKQNFSDEFHVFAVEWQPNSITFLVDGVRYKTRTPADLPPGTAWVFDHPFFIILNVAVGGGLPGNPDDTTVFPQAMKVDYIRVYKRLQN